MGFTRKSRSSVEVLICKGATHPVFSSHSLKIGENRAGDHIMASVPSFRVWPLR